MRADGRTTAIRAGPGRTGAVLLIVATLALAGEPAAAQTIDGVGAREIAATSSSGDVALLGPLVADAVAPLPAAVRPFAAGEALEYRVRFGRLGDIGQAVMRVTGPVPARGHAALLFAFDLEGRWGPFRMRDHTRSWVCEATLASLRYWKEERTPLGSRNEQVEVFPEEGRWQSADGARGRLATDLPLDELSFIYFLRTLDLRPGATHRLDRHYDPARNPVTIRVQTRETITVPAGTFTALLVEMRVRDAGRFGGEGVLRIHFSDDDRRLPLQIESVMPGAGTVRLLLDGGP
jgi:hypothetical protein